MDNIRVLRSMDNPPQEVYESTLREAIQILQDAGPRAGFVLMVVTEEGSEYKTAFGLSSGSDHIPFEVLVDLTAEWISENA